MSKPSNFRPATLTQYFESPPDYKGEFGWLCAYSADEWFTERVAERFTRETKAQRAFMGRIALALILNPEHPQLPPTEVPGVLHLPLRSSGDRPFRLMHAKVALLGFRHVSDAGQWVLRLVVSTGNWTRETAEESLDIAWSVEIRAADLIDGSEEQRLARADIAAARDFFAWLRDRFDAQALTVERPDGRASLTTLALNQVDAWCHAVRAPAGESPRFFDNRRRSLLSQLPEQVRAVGRNSASRTLAMGSGFYEGGPGGALPSVPKRIVQALQGGDGARRLLTLSAEIHLFVNPDACQSIATSAEAIAQEGWTLRAPGRPACFGPQSRRMMHAKFILGAGNSTRDAKCGPAWIYLGSGNLTGPGFARAMSTSHGNLEAGVLHVVDGLHWGTVGEEAQLHVGNLLPVQWQQAIAATDAALSAGGEMPEPGVPFLAPPVPWFAWSSEDDDASSQTASGRGWLAPPGESRQMEFQLLDPTGHSCARHHDGAFIWPHRTRPRQVELSWSADGLEHRAQVPVLDALHRFAGSELAPIDIDTAWDRLDNFPLPPNEQELDDGDDAFTPPPIGTAPRKVFAARAASASSRYPIRRIMKLVEDIAAKQTAIPRADWTAWCVRLAQTMQQTASSPDLASFAALGFNPLSPLRHAPFRPDFAETDATLEGRIYASTLREIEAAWNVGGLIPLGSIE